MEISAIERRKQPRHPVSLDVFVSPVKTDTVRVESRITNMSLLGCAIEPNSYVFKKREKLSICFVGSKEQCSLSTVIQAEVAYICRDYIGLCFESVGADVLAVLRELLKEAKYF
jgi:hypothetical protein